MERSFGLRIQRSIRLRTVMGLQTSGGRMILKRYEGDGMRRRLEALGDALDAVVCAGVNAAPYLRASGGQPYHRDQRALWTIQPWLPGRHLSLCTREERLEAARALARLHRVPTVQKTGRSFFLRVPPLWEKYRHRLERAQEATIRELGMRDGWRPYAEQARAALGDLQGASFERALELDRQHGSLCHRDPAPHNFIWQGEGAAVIDFDLAGYDVRAHDLYQLLNHALYLNGWEPGLFQEMIEAYDREMPLCPNNRRLLEGLMRYPSLVVREWYDFGKSGDRKALRIRLKWASLQEDNRRKELRLN